MTFSEKLIEARLALNLSQLELAEKTGVSERSIYSYEQAGVFPRMAVLKRLAEALSLSVTYLMDEQETEKGKGVEKDLFLSRVRQEFGRKGMQEAQAVLERATALFAGGELDDEAKEIFFQSLMEVYQESKTEAREKFTPKRRKSRKQP